MQNLQENKNSNDSEITSNDLKAQEKLLAQTQLIYLMEMVLKYPLMGRIHRVVEQFLSRVEKGSHKAILLLPRSHLKSTEVTISWTIQQLTKNPNLRILITNERLDNSKAFLREIKTHLEKSEAFIKLFGDWVNDDNKWTETQIIIKARTKTLKEPTIQVGSLDTSLVSQHYDIIIADDLVSRNNVGSKEQMDKVTQYWKDLQSLLEPDGILIDIGTRWAMDDLHGQLLKSPAYDRLVVSCYDEQGEPVFPEKFTKAYLDSLQGPPPEGIGSYDFSCLWKNDPVDDQTAAFKRSLFDNRFEDKDLAGKNLNTFITIDNAPSTKKGSDWQGIIVNSVDEQNNWYLRSVIRYKGDTPALIQKMIELYLHWKSIEMGIEQKAYNDLIKPFLEAEMTRRGVWFPVKELKDKGIRKEDRIRGRLQGRFENRKIWLQKNPTDNTEDLVDELIRFPRGANDDLADALQYQDEIAFKPFPQENLPPEPEDELLYPDIGL